MTYLVFKRKPYTRTAAGCFTPNPRARRITIRRGIATPEEAREICSRGPANIALEQNREYRHLSFYEFTKENT